MNIRGRTVALVVCAVVASQLAAAPTREMPSSLFARFLAYMQSKLSPPWPAPESKISPPIGTQSKLAPPIGAQGKLAPPIPGQPPSDTEQTIAKGTPRKP